MGELFTGITSILITIMAIFCHLMIKDSSNSRFWSFFFTSLSLTTFFSFFIHCFEMSLIFQNILWIIVYLFLGIMISFLTISSMSLFMVINKKNLFLPIFQGILVFLLMSIYQIMVESFSYAIVLILSIPSVFIFFMGCYKHKTNGKRFWIYLGLIINLIGSIIFIFNKFAFCIGQLYINESGLMHVIIAIGLLFVCLGIKSFLQEDE